MTKAINNYDKTKISMAHVFLQYDQATMIHKYSLFSLHLYVHIPYTTLSFPVAGSWNCSR